MSNWTTAKAGQDAATFQQSSGGAAYDAALQDEYDSLVEKLTGGAAGGVEYHEYQWLVGRLSGIEFSRNTMRDLVIDGTEAEGNIVG